MGSALKFASIIKKPSEAIYKITRKFTKLLVNFQNY